MMDAFPLGLHACHIAIWEAVALDGYSRIDLWIRLDCRVVFLHLHLWVLFPEILPSGPWTFATALRVNKQTSKIILAS